MHASSSRRALFSPSDSVSRVMTRASTMACLAFTLAACGGGGGEGINFAGTPAGSVVTTPSTGTGTGTAPPNPVYSLGNGSGSGFTDGVVDTNKTTLDSGDTATLRVNVVDQGNNPPGVDLTVSFASNCSSAGLATFGTVSQVTRGLFQVSYTNSGCDRAEDTVTATLTQNGDQATKKLKMVGPDVLSVSFVSATFTQLALAGIGGNETAELIFKVVGPQGVPVVGKTVDFSINTSVGGASILAGRTSGTTDQAGQARTVINSGTIAGPINVRAIERSTGKQGISPDIVISTGVPDADKFSLSTSVFNPGRAATIDGIEVTFSIIASDFFGNNPTDGTRVSFVSPESGNIQSSCLLTNGACSVVWRSAGRRPDDGRVTILAYTSGAERFVDNNGNSVYDSADGAVMDIGEPYADEDSSGAYNLGEFFFDTNKNGVRDPGNSQWDGPCLSKVDVRAVCTGAATVAIYKQAEIVLSRSDSFQIKSLGTFPAIGSTISLRQGTAVSYQNLVLKDSNTASLNGNPFPKGTTIAFSIEGAGVTLKGITTTTVSDATTPEQAGVLGVTVAADAVVPPALLPSNVRLIMKVAFPDDVRREAAWPISVTP